MTSRCRSCNAPVLWVAVGPQGERSRMPLDPDPTDDGNVRLEGRFTPSGAEAATVLGPLEAELEDELYLSHFATCPDADEWRRR